MNFISLYKPFETATYSFLFAYYLVWCLRYCSSVILKLFFFLETVLNTEIFGRVLESIKMIIVTLNNITTIMAHLLLQFNSIIVPINTGMVVTISVASFQGPVTFWGVLFTALTYLPDNLKKWSLFGFCFWCRLTSTSFCDLLCSTLIYLILIYSVFLHLFNPAFFLVNMGMIISFLLLLFSLGKDDVSHISHTGWNFYEA